jgi:hypothetical protein
MVTVPEKIVLAFLLALLAGSLAILYADATLAVPVARGICVALVLVLVVGVIFPARRALARQRERRAAVERQHAERSPSTADAKKP